MSKKQNLQSQKADNHKINIKTTKQVNENFMKER